MTREEATHISDLLLHARAMAHERHPPPGYVEAFAPNVVVERGAARALPRPQALTAERIAAIEAEWRARARAGTLRR
jgi:arabinofuranosyltransferase